MYDSCYPWAENSQNSRSSRPASSVSRLYCLTFSPLSHAFIHSCYPLPSERSTVSMADCSNGGAAIARGSGILGLRHQARSGSDRSSCQSQNLCPCCQIRVLLGGQQIGGGGQLSRVLVWEDKNRRCRETQSRERGHCGVESWIHFYESTIHFLTVQFSSLLM